MYLTNNLSLHAAYPLNRLVRRSLIFSNIALSKYNRTLVFTLNLYVISICIHEILKGVQLDTDLGSFRVCIQVGLPDHHFDQYFS